MNKELRDAAEAKQTENLSDEDLDKVAGGGSAKIVSKPMLKPTEAILYGKINVSLDY